MSLGGEIPILLQYGVWLFICNAMHKFSNLYFKFFFLFVCSLTTSPQDLSDDKGLSKSSRTPAVIDGPAQLWAWPHFSFSSFFSSHHSHCNNLISFSTKSLRVLPCELDRWLLILTTGTIKKWLLQFISSVTHDTQSRVAWPTDDLTTVQIYSLWSSRLPFCHIEI